MHLLNTSEYNHFLAFRQNWNLNWEIFLNQLMVSVSPLIFGEGIVSLNNVATPPLTSVKKKKTYSSPHTLAANRANQTGMWIWKLGYHRKHTHVRQRSCVTSLTLDLCLVLVESLYVHSSQCDMLSSGDKNNAWIYLVLTQTHCWNTTMGYSAVELSPEATFIPDQYHSLGLFTA